MNKVLIIINVHNGANYIENAIESVLNQSHPTDLLIIDNASSDGTDVIVKRYIKNEINYTRINNKITLGAARNLALNHVNNYDYFGFLDADDSIIENNYIKNIVDLFMINDVVFIYSNAIIYKDGKEIGKFSKYSDKKITKKDAIKRYDICFSSAIFSSKIFNDNKIRFNEDLSICEDTDIILSILSYGQGIYINEGYIRFNISASSNLLNNINKYAEELLHISKVNKLGFNERYSLNLVLVKTVIRNIFNIGLCKSMIILMTVLKNTFYV
ncbi:glycosyltransferase [Polynucleobacter paludilacus]|uniref:glycosyltransferase family 2 protein n=1 Tax=Polynucleobacter paludilacus TaxID=1855895 RepID=UPI001BFD7C27|nr:glycosyltransferase [Polynucleobacter paludilacus]QWD87314.1 glycosyltransferase [Polynucleobacter paludilacus]